MPAYPHSQGLKGTNTEYYYCNQHHRIHEGVCVSIHSKCKAETCDVCGNLKLYKSYHKFRHTLRKKRSKAMETKEQVTEVSQLKGVTIGEDNSRGGAKRKLSLSKVLLVICSSCTHMNSHAHKNREMSLWAVMSESAYARIWVFPKY